MKKFKIKTNDGIQEIEGHKFSHYIDNKQYWFFWEYETMNMPAITDIRSGRRVGTVRLDIIAAHLGDIKAAAKSTLDVLVKQHGLPRFLDVLNNAPALESEGV